jgi:hypothetical protein
VQPSGYERQFPAFGQAFADFPFNAGADGAPFYADDFTAEDGEHDGNRLDVCILSNRPLTSGVRFGGTFPSGGGPASV